MGPKQWGNGFKRTYNEYAASGVSSTATNNLNAELSRPKAENPVPWSKRWKQSAPVLAAVVSGLQTNSSSSSSSSSSASTSNAFRDSLAQFFLTNKLSAFETHTLASTAQNAGAAGVEDLSKAGAKGFHPKNLARDIMRSLLKDVSLPEIYWAEIPVLDPDTDTENPVWFPFLLPHEVLWKLHATNGVDKFKTFIDTEMTKEFCTTFQTDPRSTFAIGLHGDGAPFQAKMKDSLEQFSWNLCADPKSSRVVFTAVPQKFVGPNTFDAILSIFAWSMDILLRGKMLTKRHDGSPFASSKDDSNDSKFRIDLAGKPIPFRAALVQVRGDWAFYNDCFGFPHWASESICWLCKAQRSRGSQYDMRRQLWKQHRYKPGEFETLMRLLGRISALFKAPGLSLKHFMVDWLHAVDLGVGQSIVGNVLWESLDILFPNLSKKEQVKALYLKLKAWYQTSKPPSQLDGLTVEMLKLPGKAPKLRSKAGECRYLIPFAVLVARECDDGTTRRKTIRNLAEHFLQVAVIMSADPYDAAAAAAACKAVVSLYVSLEDFAVAAGDYTSWRVKPKLHMFEELIQFISFDVGSARRFWTYQDESWGGWLSNCAARRGGPKFAATVALGLLQRYRAVASDQIVE
jgi:hypothetical protein